MVRPRRRGRRPPPATMSLADRLDDASAHTQRYDVPTDFADGRSTFSEKLLVSSWVLRYWGAGSAFRRRMVRSTVVLLAAVAAALAAAAAWG